MIDAEVLDRRDAAPGAPAAAEPATAARATAEPAAAARATAARATAEPAAAEPEAVGPAGEPPADLVEPNEPAAATEPDAPPEPDTDADTDADAESKPEVADGPATVTLGEPVPGAGLEPSTEAIPVTPAARETFPERVVPERVVATTDDERPFWMPLQEMPRGSSRPPQRVRPGRPPKPPRRPATGLLALLLFALLATFFAWVSAEPLWLAVGHGNTGTATVTECTGTGVGQRCLGEFTATSGAFTAERVRLLGVGEQGGAGTTMAARMVAADSGRAYVDAATSVLHLRWGLGLALVLLCGVGLVWSTGALRLETARARRQAAAISVAAPLLVAVAFLAATF